jgi:hypothetical protein
VKYTDIAIEMGQKRINALVRAGRKLPDTATQIGNQADPTPNITVNASIYNSDPIITAERLASSRVTFSDTEDNIPIRARPAIIVESTPGSDEATQLCPKGADIVPGTKQEIQLESLDEFPTNPKLKRIHTNKVYDAEYTIDVEFLKHVIQVLIENHGIVLTAGDVKRIVSYFGDVRVKVKKQVVKVRDADVGCCTGSIDREAVVEVIKKVVLNSLNVVKHIPELVEFLGSIGITI